MINKKKKTLEILDLLTSAWSTSEYSEEKVKISGIKKTDNVEIDVSEIGLIASMLKHEDPKVQIGAVNILGLFGKNANSYVKQISELYPTFEEKEKSDIVITLAVISTLDALNELGNIIETHPSYEELFEILFHIGAFFVDYPIESLDTMLRSRNNDQFWSVIQSSFREPLERKDKKNTLEEEVQLKFAPETPIGISQEMERKRVERNAVFSRIKENMKVVLQMEESKDKVERKAAKALIKKVGKALK